MAKNDFSLLVKAKLDASQIKSDLENIKNKYGNFKIKLEFDKMPNLSGQMQKEGSKAGQAYSNAFKKAMSEKIQFKLDTGDFQTKIDSIETKLKSLKGVSDVTKTNIEMLKGAFSTLSSSDTSIEDKIAAFKQFNSLLPTIRSQLTQSAQAGREYEKTIKQAAQEQLTLTKSSTLSNNIQTWMNNNKKAAEQYGSKLKELQNQLNNNTDPGKLKEVSAEFQRIKSEAGAAGLTVGQFGFSFKNAITMALGFGSVYQVFNKVLQVTKDMVKQAIELEDAMAQLRIVTKGTESQYSSFYNTTVKTAKQIGGNIKDLIDASTVYARLGYTLDESNVLAKYTNMLQNVGDIDVSTAEDAITAIFKAYDLNIQDIESIMDKLIEVGNNYPISVAQLAEGINNAGSMLASAGNTYEETLAMLAAANTTVQDISKSSTGLRTVAARIRNTKTELDDLGEAMTDADYDALVRGLTKANVALTDAQGNFRSTYDIVKDLASVWDDLSNLDQAALAKTLAGTRQQNVFFSLIEQFQEAEKAMDSMMNSTGALSNAYGEYMDTTTAHINTFKAAFADLSNSVVDSSFLKFFVDLGTNIIEALTHVAKFVDKIGLLKGVIVGVGTALLLSGLLKVFPLIKSGITGVIHIIPNAITAWKSYAATTITTNEAIQASIPVIGLVMAAISGLAVLLTTVGGDAFKSVDERIEDTQAKLDELSESINKTATNFRNLKTNSETIIPRFSELAKGVDKYGKNISLTDDEYKEFLSLNNQIAEMFPELNLGFDDNGNAMLALSYSADTLSDSLRNLVEEQRKLANMEIAAKIPDILSNVKKQVDNYQDKIDEIEFQANDITKNDSYNRMLTQIDRLGEPYSLSGIDLEGNEVLLEEIKKLGISTNRYYSSNDYAWHNMLSLNSLTADQLAAVRGVIETLSERQNIGIDRNTELYRDKIQQEYAKLPQYFSAWLQTNIKYDELGDIQQGMASNMLNSLNFQRLFENGYDTEDEIENYIYDHILIPIEEMNPEVTNAFEKLFDLRDKFRNGDLSADEFENSVREIVDGVFSSLAPGGPASIMGDQLTKWFNLAGFDGFDTSTIVDNFVAGISTIEEKVDEFDIDYIAQDLGTVNGEVDSLTSGISSLQTVLSKQSTGTSLSIDDFNSEELKGYTSALEYHNGVLQLNAEKTREIVKANTEAELSRISYNKAVAQSKYLQNAKEIQRLTEKIRTNTYETGENQDVIEDQIELLQGENNTLLTTCAQYDLMSASLREATDSYHNWLNAQKASQAGDMFDDTLDAINRINDTLNNKDSDYFGRVGRTDYQAALDFVIPDTVDREDTDAINSYLESVSDLFTYDDNGNRAGLNITNFCKQAVEQGLMVFDEASDSYLVAGQTTMEDFAEGMNLSLPLVQAMFGEMEEFGGKFSWADEAVKTLGDLAISADVAANRLRESHGEFGFDIKLDYSDLDTTEEKIGAIEQTISNMKFMRLDVGSYDPSAVEDCDAVLQYLITQKQQLAAPAVMNIDISKVSENTGAALQLLVDFQNACNELELKQELGLDTTDAQAKVDTLYAEISGSDNDALLTLGIDTSSVETVKTSLAELSQEEVLTKLQLDASVVEGYTPEDKSATLTYIVDSSNVDAYNPKNLQRTVTYYVRTSGMDKLNGTAHAAGTAMASGDWGTAPGGETLTGELGREIVVDPHTGRWYTVGDNGAEFVNIPRGSIVFNHKQTEQLLKNGYVSGRASALVGGTAMVTGGIGAGNAGNSSHSGGNKPHSGGSSSGSGSSSSSSKPSSSSSNSSNSSSKSDKEPQIIDWIEIAIARIEREIKKLKTVAESTYKSLKTKLGASYDEIAKVNKEIAVQQQGYNRYLKQAESVGLSSGLKEKVRNGTIDINQYDEDTQKLIKDYQEWYEKALDCADAVDELHESLAKLYEDNFNATQEDFENKLSLIEHLTKMYQSGIDLFEAKGYLESTKFTKAMQEANAQRLSTLNQELSALKQKFSEAMASGEIEVGSESWYKMQQEINACKEAIADANVEAAELAKTVREIEWGYFDYEQDRISQLTQEADFLIDLMNNQDLHDDRGQLTDYGMATMGLHGQNYNVYMAQADDYAKEILALDKQIADDPYNTDLIKRREELIKLQQESIKNAEAEKQAMIELVKQGIQIELSALKDLIDAYKESLDNAKALYEYQSNVTDKAAEIARLQKQLSAYSGDTSAETQATVQKLQVDLSKAQEDLAKTEYEQFISDQKKLLDELYDEYEEVLNQRLDDVDVLISDLIDGVNSNSDKINETIGGVAADVGYNLTPQMQEIWNNSTGSTEGVISKYGDDFSEKLTAVNSVLAGIHANVADMIEHSDEEADADVGSQTPTTEPTPPSDGGGNPPPAPKPSDDGGGGGATLDEQTKKKVAAAIWRGGLGWGVNPDRAKRLKEVFGANNGIQALVNKGVGKNDGGSDVKNYTYLAMRKKFKGYKTGGLVDYTGLAQVDGTPQKPELMLNANDAQNFIALRDVLRNLSMQPISLGKQFDLDTPLFSGIADMSERLASMRTPVGNSGTTFGDFEINIPIENVQDYNDFVQQLRNDPQFEEMIIGMTLGKALGKTSLSKYKYQWK